MVKNLGNNSKKLNTEIQKKSFLKLYSELIKLGWIDHNHIYVGFGIVYNIYNNIGTQLIKYLYWDIKIIPERIYIVILNFINILKNKNNIKEIINTKITYVYGDLFYLNNLEPITII